MRFEHVNQYDASPADVFRMLTDQAFRERVCEAVQAPSYTVDVVASGDATTVSIAQTQRVRKVPSFAAKLVGDAIEVKQRERWTSATAAEVETTIPGKPGHLKGTIALEPVGEGTRQVVSGELKVSVPLVGGKLEGVIADLLKLAMRTEETEGRAWLAGER
jgi:uncharacterized protein YndB with AHSA1/START domain